MPHVALLGDSIFDNAAYVEPGGAVIDCLRKRLPENWQATLLARDGSVILDVVRQLAQVANDVTHIIISCGGNDALGQLGFLQQPVSTILGALQHLVKIQSAFQSDYLWMIEQARAKKIDLAICTIYDSVPSLDREVLATLALFNDVISRAATGIGLPLLDLRVLLNQPQDYARISPIEPSAQGSEKIAEAICSLLHTQPQSVTTSQVWGGLQT